MDDERQKILIVDDERFNINVLVELLKPEHKTTVAKNGRQALERVLMGTPPDLILLDVMMPGMDGYEVIHKLKDNEKTKNIPVIFITALSQTSDEAKGFDLGAVDYITKPFQPTIVKARVNTHLRLKRKSDLLESLVALDGLTEIPNRRRFDETLDLEWKRAIRNNNLLSLVLMDIDHFKLYNDNYGHAAGDVCLKKVARSIEKVPQRPADLVARYGGEEFVAVLPETDGEGATQIAEQMREAVFSLGVTHEFSSASDVVTISLGVATIYPVVEIDQKYLIEQADKGLYDAKEEGRNRFVDVDMTISYDTD